MQAVWLAVPEHFLEERRQLGHDKWDELWDGVLHMPPTPTFAHGFAATELVIALAPIVKRRGWGVLADGNGLYDHELNYRVPDAAVYAPSDVSERGLEGARLVVEMLSPHDEARKKFPFYANKGVGEIWLIEPYSRVHEVHVLRGNRYVPAKTIGGMAHSEILDITLEVADGPVLRLRDGDSVIDI